MHQRVDQGQHSAIVILPSLVEGDNWPRLCLRLGLRLGLRVGVGYVLDTLRLTSMNCKKEQRGSQVPCSLACVDAPNSIGTLHGQFSRVLASRSQDRRSHRASVYRKRAIRAMSIARWRYAVDTVESGIVVDGTTSQWHSGSRGRGIWSKGVAFLSIGRCLFMKWRVPNLGEDLLGLVLPPGEVLCGDLSLASREGRTTSSLAKTKRKLADICFISIRAFCPSRA